MQNKSQVSIIRKRPLQANKRKENTSMTFTQQVLGIPEVIQVSVCESDNNPDVFVIYNSEEKETRFKIYELAQNVLLIDVDKPMDFHTINLNDYEKSEWEFIIPHDSVTTYTRKIS